MGVPLITGNPGVEEALLVPPVVCPPVVSSLVGASSLFHPLMRRMLSAYARSQRFKIVLQHFHNELLVAGVSPAIAADQHLAVVIDFHKRAIAVATGLVAHLRSSASLIAK